MVLELASLLAFAVGADLQLLEWAQFVGIAKSDSCWMHKK
jgi:hypothetical protein